MAEVHLQNKNGSWYFNCGAVLDVQRQRKAKKHCLGTDYALAQRKGQALQLAWDMETTVDPATGLKVWSPGRLAAAMAFATEQAPAPAIPKVERKVVVAKEDYVPPPESYTLDTALTAFCEWFNKRDDLSTRWRDSVKERIDSIKVLFRDKSSLLDVPMREMGQDHLDEMRRLIVARPPTRQSCKHIGSPLSVIVCHHWLQTLSMAFDHFMRHTKYGWTPPNYLWKETFSLTKKQMWAMMTKTERHEIDDPADIYTIQEVSDIYRKTSPMTKRYILMAVLLGWSQEAIASFRKDELVQIGEDYFIQRRRGKTGVAGKWWVAPELAKILIDAMKRTPANADNLAFLTENEEPLVHDNTDAIKLCWQRALNQMWGTPKSKRYVKDAKRLSFGKLKKLGGQLVQNVSGNHTLAQLLLCHGTDTVAAKHYVFNGAASGIGKPLQERLFDVQKEIWKEIKPLFIPTAAAETPKQMQIAA